MRWLYAWKEMWELERAGRVRERKKRRERGGRETGEYQGCGGERSMFRWDLVEKLGSRDGLET